MAGLFFCLASAKGAGLLFCPAAIQPHTSVYRAFCFVNATIPPTPQNSAQGFTDAFQIICRVLPLLYGGASCYAVQPARRWMAYRQAQRLHRYQISPPRQTLHRSAQPPYYNKVYKGAAVRPPVMDPCQTVQQIADHASPVGSASPPVQGQPGGWSFGARSAVRPGILTRSTRQGRPAARARWAARNHWRLAAVSLFGLSPDSQ